MGKFWISLGAAVVFNCMTPHIAAAIPFDPARVPDGATEVGRFFSGVNFVGTAALAYDSSSGQLSYHVGGGDFVPANTLDPLGPFTGLFGWTAVIDQLGEIQGTGAASMILDLGNGPELLATGTVVDFGFRSVSCFPAGAADCLSFFSHPQVSIEMSFVDPRIAQFLGDFWLWEGFLTIDMDQRLLSDNFLCGITPSSSVNCGRSSGDEIVGYRNVAEPGTLALLSLGLLGLGLARRRRSDRCL